MQVVGNEIVLHSRVHLGDISTLSLHVYIYISLDFGRAGQEIKDVTVILKYTPVLVRLEVESQCGSIFDVHMGIIVNWGGNALDTIIIFSNSRKKTSLSFNGSSMII